jgi:hypothetical protein
MLLNELKEVVDQIPAISAERNYWFVRTEGGLFYNQFIRHDVIAIGYNELTPERVGDVIRYARRPKRALMDYIKKNYRDIKRPGLVASQLLRFLIDIKVGDVVIIPGINSTELSFGIVSDGATIDANFPKEDNQYNCDYKKGQASRLDKSRKAFYFKSGALQHVFCKTNHSKWQGLRLLY